MSAPALLLDFSGRRRAQAVAGVVIAAIGIAALAGTMLRWQQHRGQVAGLQLQFEERSAAAARHSGREPVDAATSVTARAIATELATPWSTMLGDLEAAGRESRGDVAVLSVEPDREHGRIRLTAEARDLGAALAYLKRLQQRPAVRNALLENHEVQVKSAERPVRVRISADWSQGT